MVFMEKIHLAPILLQAADMNPIGSPLSPVYCVRISRNQPRISFADDRYVLVTTQVVP
jgi:hypothetical protein